MWFCVEVACTADAQATSAVGLMDDNRLAFILDIIPLDQLFQIAERVRDVEKRLGGEAPRPPAGGAPGA